MLRGRIRKFGLHNEIDVLAENTEDKANCVRFAVTNRENETIVSSYVKTIISDAVVSEVSSDIANPVLSKLKVNQQDRYTL